MPQLCAEPGEVEGDTRLEAVVARTQELTKERLGRRAAGSVVLAGAPPGSHTATGLGRNSSAPKSIPDPSPRTSSVPFSPRCTPRMSATGAVSVVIPASIAGESAITIDGAGDIRRCHFVKAVIGNIYQPDWRAALRRRACPNATCGCHIGYVHLPRLNQQAIYGDGLLARIPQEAR